jgi:hypothetical protein
MENSYKNQKRSRGVISLIVILVTVYLLSVVTFDVFILTPKKTEKIELVQEKFSEMKSYLDAKLPEIDSALFQHSIQIDEQNIQLEELNKLTSVLKEDNKK